MKIAIIDDNPQEFELYNDSIQKWMQLHSLLSPTDFFTSGEDFLKDFKPGKYSLLFMDIYMGELNGIETARKVRELDVNCLIIFLTASLEHTWDAFPIHPFDYLIKGCPQEKIFQVLDEAMRTLPQAETYIEVPVGRQQVRISCSELMYAVADDHHTLITTCNSSQPLRCHIFFSGLLKELPEDPRFLQCNRGILLNQDYITGLQKDSFLMEDRKLFPIRRSNIGKIKQQFYDYQFDTLSKMKGIF